MTTGDIEQAQITLKCKNGHMLVGFSEDPILLNLIASYVKFVELAPDKVTTVPITELLKPN